VYLWNFAFVCYTQVLYIIAFNLHRQKYCRSLPLNLWLALLRHTSRVVRDLCMWAADAPLVLNPQVRYQKHTYLSLSAVSVLSPGGKGEVSRAVPWKITCAVPLGVSRVVPLLLQDRTYRSGFQEREAKRLSHS
jgi:hypothetical protein